MATSVELLKEWNQIDNDYMQKIVKHSYYDYVLSHYNQDIIKEIVTRDNVLRRYEVDVTMLKFRETFKQLQDVISIGVRSSRSARFGSSTGQQAKRSRMSSSDAIAAAESSSSVLVTRIRETFSEVMNASEDVGKDLFAEVMRLINAAESEEHLEELRAFCQRDERECSPVDMTDRIIAWLNSQQENEMAEG